MELEKAGEPKESFAEQLRFTVGLRSNLVRVYEAADDRVLTRSLVRSSPKLVFREVSFRTSPERDILVLLNGETQKMKTPALGRELASRKAALTRRHSNRTPSRSCAATSSGCTG